MYVWHMLSALNSTISYSICFVLYASMYMSYMHVYICCSLLWFPPTPSPRLQVEFEPVVWLVTSARVKFEPLCARHSAIRARRTSLLMYTLQICMYVLFYVAFKHQLMYVCLYTMHIVLRSCRFGTCRGSQGHLQQFVRNSRFFGSTSLLAKLLDSCMCMCVCDRCV